MLNVVEMMPIHHLSDHELQVREWEAVMGGGYGSTEHCVVRREIERRVSTGDNARPATLH